MKINERTGQVIIDKKEYHLTRTEMRVLISLKENKGTYEEIYYSLYRIKEDRLRPAEIECLSSIVSRIRKKTGLEIKNYSSYGYYLGGTNGKIQ